MTGPYSSSPLVITDAQQASILTDVNLRRYALPFMGRAATVSQVALELGMKTNAMLYRVQHMLECGLLEVAHLKERPGRAIRHYRCIGDELFVPFEATPFETQEAQIEHTEQLTQKRFTRALVAVRRQQLQQGGWGTLISRNEHGVVSIERKRLIAGVSSTEQPLPFSISSELRIRPETALELATRLRAVLDDYIYDAEDDAEDTRTYLLQVGLTPE